ncbi:hypothetical protein FHS39_002828 [Streptomyces olivoverticillatus]|uniref:eCIS core domain-containing protein n=1 Tax=Streptomyces olivoverticillatus TaxID=66427 RepID=A0A7W7LPX0_9ACTN|nr:DUF4157 domain-containing protein [Streptomyces olivoverticillatus]MBB4893797.1 hypothetical protein [Streptomyces olivoverticillatus]
MSLDAALASPGRPLEPRIREKAERVYPMNFGHVRMHDGPVAQQAAREFEAEAFTVGPHIVAGQRNLPDETVLHEIDHAFWNTMGHPPAMDTAGTVDSAGVRVSSPRDAQEVMAAANGKKVAQGGTPDLSLPGRPAPVGDAGPGGPSVQRSPRSWAGSEEIRKAQGLRKGLLPGSRWPDVVAALKRYGEVGEDDLAARRSALEEVEARIGVWEGSQGRGNRGRATDNTRDKQRAVAEVRHLITAERREIHDLEAARQPRRAQPAAPMSIAGRGGSRTSGPSGGHSDGSSSGPSYGDSASTLRSPDMNASERAAARYVNAPRLPAGVSCAIQHTAHAASINRVGIRPAMGRGGIGLPDTQQQPDRQAFYVDSGSERGQGVSNMIAMDAAAVGADRLICVLGKNVAYSEDTNYGPGGRGAKSYVGNAPPIRHREEQPRGPLSFPLPLGNGSTLDRVTEFLNSHLPDDRQLTPDQAKAMVYGHLVRVIGALIVAPHLD